MMSLAQRARRSPIIADHKIDFPMPASFGLPAEISISTAPIIMAMVAKGIAKSFTKKSRIFDNMRPTLSQVHGQSGVPEQVTMPPVGQTLPVTSARVGAGIRIVAINKERRLAKKMFLIMKIV